LDAIFSNKCGCCNDCCESSCGCGGGEGAAAASGDAAPAPAPPAPVPTAADPSASYRKAGTLRPVKYIR
jgi:hypothetical protein